MNFDALVDLVGAQGWFEFATLVQMTDERRSSLQVQIHRWMEAGKLLHLRRGMYALPERYRRNRLSSAELANRLYAPSYLSMHWALGYYGMIPERVQQHTSITRRKSARFENDFGTFVYRNIKAEAFFGYRCMDLAGTRVQMAEPEKALLDLWHLEEGKWDRLRMEEMRFQASDRVAPERLRAHAVRFRSARVEAAARVWLELNGQPEEGVEL